MVEAVGSSDENFGYIKEFVTEPVIEVASGIGEHSDGVIAIGAVNLPHHTGVAIFEIARVVVIGSRLSILVSGVLHAFFEIATVAIAITTNRVKDSDESGIRIFRIRSATGSRESIRRADHHLGR